MYVYTFNDGVYTEEALRKVMDEEIEECLAEEYTVRGLLEALSPDLRTMIRDEMFRNILDDRTMIADRKELIS